MANRVVTCTSCKTKNRVPVAATGLPQCASCKTKLPWLVDATDADFTQAIDTKAVVLVDLWASWCQPCRMVAPILEQLAATHAGQLKVIKIDVDANPRLAAQYEASSIPLLLIMVNGQVRDRVVGAQPAPILEQRLSLFLKR